MSETPLFANEICYGLNLQNINTDSLRNTKRISLNWITELYASFPEKNKFFDRSLSKEMGNIDFLVGVSDFKKQVIAGQTIEQIQNSWEPKLSKYKIMRKKYLLYPD